MSKSIQKIGNGGAMVRGVGGALAAMEVAKEAFLTARVILDGYNDRARIRTMTEAAVIMREETRKDARTAEGYYKRHKGEMDEETRKSFHLGYLEILLKRRES